MKKLVRNIVLGLFSIFVFQSCLSNYGGVSTYLNNFRFNKKNIE